MASNSSAFTNSYEDEYASGETNTQPTTYSQELTNQLHAEEDLSNSKGFNLVWGKLLPASNASKFMAVDLIEDSYTFGRHGCDITITAHEVGDVNLKNISKHHFSIKRRMTTTGPEVVLENYSINGTFVDSYRVEKGEEKILVSSSIIAPALLCCKAYCFIDLRPDSTFPEAVTKKYTILNKLGAGSFGFVYKAVRNIDDVFVAMKEIQKSSHGSVAGNKQLEREIRISQQVNNHHTIRIIEVIECAVKVYLVLELMEGGEFSSYLMNKLRPRLSEEVAKFYFLQMALGVGYLHETGIVHRDIKPENMLLESCDDLTTLKISDFGLSKYVHSTKLTTFVGSPLYVSPEVLNGRGRFEYGPKVDCWSLGVILFTMLSGEQPFSNRFHDLPVNVQISTGRVRYKEKLWHSVSKEATDLVKRLLEVDPDRRLSIQETLNHSWLQDETVKQRVADVYLSKEALKRPFSSLKENGELELVSKRMKLSSDTTDV